MKKASYGRSSPLRARRWLGVALATAVAGCLWAAAGSAAAETCITQSQMAPADRTALAGAAMDFAAKVGADDAGGLRAATIAEYAQNFDGIASSVVSTASHLKGAQYVVRGIYLLDATNLKSKADGTLPTAEFYCSLNNSPSGTNFTIPGLPAGKYALATVDATGIAAPWQLTFVLQQTKGRWLLAGFIPKPASAAGHDGVWYWTQARDYAKRDEPWDAWLYYQTAERLLVPVDFVNSTNLEKLRSEAQAIRPQALQPMPSAEHPLTVKGKSETFLVTSVGTDDALGGLDLVLHVTAADTSDPVAARQRDIQAMQAVLAAYPEIAQAFHGVWVFADAPGRSPFGIELPMAQVSATAQSLLLPSRLTQATVLSSSAPQPLSSAPNPAM